mmetsp:Transcript_3240/g.4728  ORF Transcript_3240/g.4728 Transcript_3240/m.4728 type:complete len:111 (+) Transcript_3240:83-415(+)
MQQDTYSIFFFIHVSYLYFHGGLRGNGINFSQQTKSHLCPFSSNPNTTLSLLKHSKKEKNEMICPSAFPPVPTILTKDKHSHWLIRTPRLFLRTRSFVTLTPPTREQTGL